MTPQSRATPILLGILTTIMVGWVLHVSASILQPLVIALLLASMLQPVVRWLAHRHIPPPVTIILLVMLLFFGIARAGLLLQEALIEFVRNKPDTTSPSLQLPKLGFEGESAEPEVDESDQASAGSEEEGTPAQDGTPEDAPRDSDSDASEDWTGDVAPIPPPADSSVAGLDEGPPRVPSQASEEQLTPLGPDPPPTLPGDPTAASQDASGLLGWGGIVDKIENKIRELNWDEKVVKYITRALKDVDLESSAIGLIGGGFDFTRNLLLVLIYMVFIFTEQAVFRRKILSIAGRRRTDAAQVLDTIGRGIQRYLGVKTIISLATGVLCYSVLEALQVPYRLLFGFLTIFLNYIPTFGSIIAGIFPTLVALLDSPINALIVVFTYLFVNIALGSFLEPRILGRELNLSPLVIIVSVVVWAGIWGIVGTFLAVPLTAAAQIILASQESTRPIAIMLSSGPPRETRRRRRRARRRKDIP